MPLAEREGQAVIRPEPGHAVPEGRGGPAVEARAPAERRRAVRPYETLFVFGCPRSGTTWVQLLLAQHPAVATAPETQIFAYYLDHFLRQWRHEQSRARVQGKAGLSRLLSEAEFEELCRTAALVVLDKIAARNPGARVVVEKSPRHALQAEFIHRVLPDAYFLHVIRDPRDTAASLLAAGRSWARWAPKNPIDAARLWTSHIEHARAIQGATDRYREVRYEALAGDTARELHGILEWLGIPLDAEACERAVQNCSLARLQKVEHGKDIPIPAERSPKGFFRKGAPGSWSQELRRRQVELIELVCRDLMRETGYAPATTAGITARLRIRAHDAIQRARESVDWQLQKLLYRV